MGDSGAVPQFLAIGHITRDLRGQTHTIGGAVSYAALTASRLGMDAAVLTSVAKEDLQAARDLTGARVVSGPSPVTTVFENLYEGDDRKQRIHTMADPVSPGGLPEGWQGCPVVLLAPVAGEVDPSFAALFPRSLLGVSPQGWMRRWDSEGWVDRKCWSGRGVIDRADVVVVSEADFSSGRLPPSWLKDRAIVVLTHGRDGATVVHGGRRLRVPPYPAQEVDPTGAGDVFAAAYLISYYEYESGDSLGSALFASCAASLSVESPRLRGIPTRERVLERMEKFPHHRVLPL